MDFDYQKIESIYPEAGNLMFKPMLIWKLPEGKEHMLSEVCEKGNYFLQEKIDGALYQTVRTENHTYLFSRTESKTNGLLVNKADNVPAIIDAFSCLPPKTILIGEVYIPGGTAKDTVSVMGCLPALAIKKQETVKVMYYVHDIIYFDGISLISTGAEDRYNILHAIWYKYGLDKFDCLRLAVKVDENQEEELARILANGGEGIVLKKRDAVYSPGKRPAWATIKCKTMDTVDLVCMGFTSATKIYTGKELETWSYWAFEHEEGEDLTNIRPSEDIIADWFPITKGYYYGWKTAIEIGAYDSEGNLRKLGTVSSGITDELRSAFAEHSEDYLGKVMELSCMSIDKKEHTLRHPVFKRFREDKKAEDCTIEEVFR